MPRLQSLMAFLGLLNDEELEGVLAHELGHVNNRDILISSIAATIAGAITYVARFGFFFGGMGDRDDRRGGAGSLLMLILAPIAAVLIQLAVSRSREYQADETGAHFTGNPYASSQCAGETGCLLATRAYGSYTVDRTFVHHPAFAGNELWQLVLHPSPVAKRIERLTGRPAEFTQ